MGQLRRVALIVAIVPFLAVGPSAHAATRQTTVGFARLRTGQPITWYLRYSNTQGRSDAHFDFGNADTDFPVTGDWDGNHTDTIGFARLREGQPITWYLRNLNSEGHSSLSFNFGNSDTDFPVVGDWNGDGKDSIGIVRINKDGSFTWYLKYFNSAGGSNVHFNFGRLGDLPIVGDWDGNGTDSIGVARNDTSSHWVWYLKYQNSAGGSNVHFDCGIPERDYPVVGDWNGDKVDTVGIARISADPLYWRLRDSNSTGSSDYRFAFGREPGDFPVTGDWDGY